MSLSFRRLVLGLAGLLLAGAASGYDITNTVYVNYANGHGDAQPTLTSSTSFTAPEPLVTVLKTASTADFRDGEDTVFTLTAINVGGATAFNVEVLDTLPGLVAYVANSAAPAPDPGWAPNAGPPEVLRWTIPKLDIGAVWSVTVGGRAGPPGASPQVVANTMRVHYRTGDGILSLVTDSVPVALTIRPAVVPPTPPGAPAGLSAIAAGAVIGLAWTPAVAGSLPVTSYAVYRATYAGLVPAPGLLLGTVWVATASVYADTVAAVGVTYTYVVVARDTGATAGAPSNEATASIAVSPPVPPVTPGPTNPVVVSIFDTSGRLIRTLTALATVEDVTLRTVGDGSGHASLAAGADIAIVLSDGTRIAWNGRDEAGAPVPNGMYTVRLSDRMPDGREEISTATIAVTRPYQHVIENAMMVPNPANEAAWLSFRLADTTGAVDLKIYNVAGELVFKGELPGTARSYRWDLRNRSGTRVAAGLYVVVLEAADSTGVRKDRAIMKLAVEDGHR